MQINEWMNTYKEPTSFPVHVGFPRESHGNGIHRRGSFRLASTFAFSLGCSVCGDGVIRDSGLAANAFDYKQMTTDRAWTHSDEAAG